MALIVEFTVPVSKFALFNTLTAVPDTTLELGRVIDTTPEDITVYVWARTPDFDALEAAFDDDPSVTSFTVSSETADGRSYYMTRNEPIDLLVHIMTEQQGTIIHAVTALVAARSILAHDRALRPVVDDLGVIRQLALVDWLLVEQLAIVEQRLNVLADVLKRFAILFRNALGDRDLR